MIGIRFSFIEDRRRIADLSELHEALKYGKLRFLNALTVDHSKDLIPVIITVGIVYFALFVLHFAKENRLRFFWKVLSHLLLRATQNKWEKKLPQMILPIRLAKFVDRHGKLLPE